MGNLSNTTINGVSYEFKDAGAARQSHSHTKSQITDFPTSMPASDVSAWAKASSKPSYTQDEVSDGSTYKRVTSTEKNTWNSKGTYSKPSGGIPKTDLASAVQTSLGLADTSLQHSTVTGSPDLDTYLTTGVYHIATQTATHAPTTNHATLFVDATVGTPYQIFKPDSNDTVWYTRHRSGSTWTAWVAMKFTDTTYSAATTSAAGLMSATDKSKLDGIASGAQVNSITGVKGNSESSYRTGNVNLTPANIGAAASSHTHNYAGSSSAGGAATSANKLNTNAGSATQPVYFSNGVPVATTYSLGKSVPSDAKFTDTTYSVATASANGLMSSGDKAIVNKLSSTYTALTPVATNVEVYTGGYVTIGKLCIINAAFKIKNNYATSIFKNLPIPAASEIDVWLKPGEDLPVYLDDSGYLRSPISIAPSSTVYSFNVVYVTT